MNLCDNLRHLGTQDASQATRWRRQPSHVSLWLCCWRGDRLCLPLPLPGPLQARATCHHRPTQSLPGPPWVEGLLGTCCHVYPGPLGPGFVASFQPSGWWHGSSQSAGRLAGDCRPQCIRPSACPRPGQGISEQRELSLPSRPQRETQRKAHGCLEGCGSVAAAPPLQTRPGRWPPWGTAGCLSRPGLPTAPSSRCGRQGQRPSLAGPPAPRAEPPS